jgi:predicted HD phosphohydrolase
VEYWANLSADSKRSLELQGGIYTAAEADAFMTQPHAAGAVQLRLWDDQAKLADAVTPGLERYLELAARLSAPA